MLTDVQQQVEAAVQELTVVDACILSHPQHARYRRFRLLERAMAHANTGDSEPFVKCPRPLLSLMKAMSIRSAQWLRDVESGVHQDFYYMWWEEIMEQLDKLRRSMDMGFIYPLEGV
jgi:hypothetical protein